MQEATFRMWISFCFLINARHWRGRRATGKSLGNKPMCILAGSRFTHTYCEKVWDNKGTAKTGELLVNKAHELFSYKRVGGHFISLQRLEPEVSWFQDVVVHIYSRGRGSCTTMHWGVSSLFPCRSGYRNQVIKLGRRAFKHTEHLPSSEPCFALEFWRICISLLHKYFYSPQLKSEVSWDLFEHQQ